MIPSKTQRSLSILRSLSGSANQAMAPHAAYMKITTIELEKMRLGKARDHALHRMGEIDARLRELEAQKAALMSAMEAVHAAPPPARGPAARGLRPRVAGRVRLAY
ncbi:MAG TPA: hypothetical protein VGH29_03100 [Candidatus Binataceae bacterium]